VYQSRRLIDRTKEKDDVVPCTLLELTKFSEPYKLAFQELYRLACIALTLPVSSASCERSFSAMKLIKSHLRSTMCDSRLSDIAVLSIESSRAESLSLDAFVDEFDARHHTVGHGSGPSADRVGSRCQWVGSGPNFRQVWRVGSGRVRLFQVH